MTAIDPHVFDPNTDPRISALCAECGAYAPAPQHRPHHPAPAVTGERAETYCETCAHPINVRRGGFCIAAGHVVSVVQITVHTFNATRPRPFTATPAPYLGGRVDAASRIR